MFCFFLVHYLPNPNNLFDTDNGAAEKPVVLLLLLFRFLGWLFHGLPSRTQTHTLTHTHTQISNTATAAGALLIVLPARRTALRTSNFYHPLFPCCLGLEGHFSLFNYLTFLLLFVWDVNSLYLFLAGFRLLLSLALLELRIGGRGFLIFVF